MDINPVHVDEFGTLSFSIHHEGGNTYTFEQEHESHLLFITLKDINGRAIGKKLVDTEKLENREIVDIYYEYLKEQDTNDNRKPNSTDG